MKWAIPAEYIFSTTAWDTVTKIRYNIVKDSVGIGYEKGFTAEGALGIYIDDMSSGVEVTGNIIYNVREPAIFGHGGRYLTLTIMLL